MSFTTNDPVYDTLSFNDGEIEYKPLADITPVELAIISNLHDVLIARAASNRFLPHSNKSLLEYFEKHGIARHYKVKA